MKLLSLKDNQPLKFRQDSKSKNITKKTAKQNTTIKQTELKKL